MFRKLLPVVMTALSLLACTPTVDIRGKLVPPELLSQIKVGETTQEKVQILLGSPSNAINYGDETWHYIYEKVETVSFFDPKVLDYNTVTIVFDDKSVVKSVERVDKNGLKTVDLVSRETPTAGKEMSVIEQLVGNVGKFSKALGGPGGAGGGGGAGGPGGRP